MAKVYKQIRGGVSFYGQTTAVGDINTVLRTGIMPCGSGDDHTLLKREIQMLEQHQGDGDLTLPTGKLGQGKIFTGTRN